MTWLRLDDNFPEGLKVAGLSADAFRAHVRAMCYCARNLTDGVVPRAIARDLTRRKSVEKELISASVWEKNGADFYVHDYLDYNPSREEVRARRAAKSMAGVKGAAKRWASSSHGSSHDGKNAPIPVVSSKESIQSSTHYSAGGPVQNVIGVTGDQRYLNNQLTERVELWDVGEPWIVRLNQEFGVPAVTSALRFARASDDEGRLKIAVSAAAYLWNVALDRSRGEEA